MEQKTMCSVFNCEHRHGNYCCANCDDYDKCKSHCLNDPVLCGLAVKQTKKSICIVKAEVEK